MDWPLDRLTGSAEELHHCALPTRRGLWVCTPDRPAVVLGSSQPESDIDIEMCRSLGIDVVRRRSGGGAVYVHPTESLWVDVVIPRGDPLWCDDIGESMWWLGDAWQATLIGAGVAETRVHRGAMVTSDWSRTLCFAGVGPGEVLHITPGEADSSGRPGKVVGISQRRNREMARFQCVMYRRWDAALHARMLPALAHDPDRISACAWAVADVDKLNLLGQHIS